LYLYIKEKSGGEGKEDIVLIEKLKEKNFNGGWLKTDISQ